MRHLNVPSRRHHQPASERDAPQRSDRWRPAAHLVAGCLAIAASATSLRNGYALDDLALIFDNARVHSLDRWWHLFALPYWPPQFGASLYRPLVALGFALQWVAGAGSPAVFHLTSIGLYALTCVLVAALALELLPARAAFVAAALFAVHPVHVEAVANVVGQSELLAGCAAVAAIVIYLRGRRDGRPLRAGAVASIGVLFLIACLCKEHAVLLPLLVAMLELFGVRRSGNATPTLRDRARATAPLIATMAAIGISYVVVRTIVLGGLLGERHLVPVDGIRRVWVMLVVAPHWLRLLTWPAHLSAEYSPQAIVIPDGPGLAILPGLAIFAAVTAAFVALGSGTEATRLFRATARAGLAWLAITLLPVSNLFSVMLVAERTLFLPSVGVIVIVGAAVAAIESRVASTPQVRTTRLAVAAVITTLLALGTARSVTRQRVWRDDATLFAQTVRDVPASYRAEFFYGQMLFEEGQLAEGERRLRLAIALNPTPSDASPLNYLATRYRDARMCPQALPLYERAIANDDRRPDVRYGLATCLLETGHWSDARRLADDGVRRGDFRNLFQQLIARTDSARVVEEHHGGARTSAGGPDSATGRPATTRPVRR